MNTVYILEYDGSTFHKNYIAVEPGAGVVTDYPLGSAGYIPLAVVVKGTRLEALLQVMIASFREMDTNPTIESVRNIVNLCFESQWPEAF